MTDPANPEDAFALRPHEDRPRPLETPQLLEASYPLSSDEDGAAEPSDAPRRKKRNTARLVWDSKPKKAPNPKNLGFQIAEVVVPNPASQSGPRLPFDAGTQEVDTRACNRLIWGDNLLVMQALLAQGYEGKINLIYIDPPFDSKADYSHTVQLTPDDSGKGGGELNAEMSALERLAYRDTWEDGTDSYLDMLYPRLQLMHRLLAEDGSIYLHLGKPVAHYVRVVCEEVFGKTNFVNEITWQRSHAHGDTGQGATHFGRTTESILYFSKSGNTMWHPLHKPYTDEILARDYKYTDENNGERYRLMPVDGPGGAQKGNPYYEFLGVKGYWRYSLETMTKLHEKGEVILSSTGKSLSRKKYLKDANGTPIVDLWDDVNRISPTSNERLDYPTQKPEVLLERILKASSRPGDLVADFFCGSGTTAAVAEKLGRRWITSDLGKASLQVARNRFVKMGEPGSGGIAFNRPDGATRCSPFVVENLGNYQRQLIYLNDHRLRQVGPLILTLFGAQPHPTERNLGTQAFNDPETGRFQRRLVLVGDPDRPLSARRVAETARMLKTLDGGGYAKLVALGWDFELNFDSVLEKSLGGDWRKIVEARQIPTEVIEYLKKMPEKAAPDDPVVEKLRGQVAFFEKPYLGLPEVRLMGWTDEAAPRLRAQLRLTSYTLRGLPMGILGKKPSEAEARELIQGAGGPTGLNLIDFWSVDEDLGGEDGKRPFTSAWQELRGLGKRVKPVITGTELLYTPRPGRKVGLRLVDIFGNDAMWSGLLPDAEDARRAGF
ncbi:MAG TPA: site-specific DNA-methyltransferase [Holophagaceae bacterium]|nr:site-specific DNA-methyltransferase [Holophagaceae bacterium]